MSLDPARLQRRKQDSTFGRVDAIDREYLEWLRDSSQETADALGTYLELTEPEGGE